MIPIYTNKVMTVELEKRCVPINNIMPPLLKFAQSTRISEVKNARKKIVLKTYGL